MLLRFRGPDGMVRITVEPADTFARLGEKVHFLNFLKDMFLY
jgi:nuclear protein localization protein 4 homolog